MIVVVPCFNEAGRIDLDAWKAASEILTAIVFVDDGSTDDTRARLKTLAENTDDGPGRIRLVGLDSNRGKGNAVRAGMRRAIEIFPRADTIAFTDADLSTPPDELTRLAGVLRARDLDLVLGSRQRLPGTEIERSAARHLLGRAGSALINRVLGIAVRDTQAGAKVFTAGAARQLFEEAFVSRWLFDCEIILRAEARGRRYVEEPLRRWTHQGGHSKFRAHSYFGCVVELLRIWHHYRTQRRSPGRAKPNQTDQR